MSDILNARSPEAAPLVAGSGPVHARAHCIASGADLGMVIAEGCNNLVLRDAAGIVRNRRPGAVRVVAALARSAYPPSPEFSPGHVPVGLLPEPGR